MSSANLRNRTLLTVNRDKGYSAVDIISTMFRVTKTIDTFSEHVKLEYIKVWQPRINLELC